MNLLLVTLLVTSGCGRASRFSVASWCETTQSLDSDRKETIEPTPGRKFILAGVEMTPDIFWKIDPNDDTAWSHADEMTLGSTPSEESHKARYFYSKSSTGGMTCTDAAFWPKEKALADRRILKKIYIFSVPSQETKRNWQINLRTNAQVPLVDGRATGLQEFVKKMTTD